MEIICKPRRYGKTTELIKLASKEEYGLIVCHSREEAYRIFEMSFKMRKNNEIDGFIPLPITYQEYLGGAYYGKNVSKIFIDNADAFLQSFCPIEIGAITLTTGECKEL